MENLGSVTVEYRLRKFRGLRRRPCESSIAGRGRPREGSLDGSRPASRGVPGCPVTISEPEDFRSYCPTIKRSKSPSTPSIHSVGISPLRCGRSSISWSIGYAVLWVLLELFAIDYLWIFMLGGGVCLVLALFMWLGFPHFESATKQHTHLILRKRYWLYYGLTFFSGARRQIFMVFAAFLMVEKFGYSAAQVTLLFLINYAFNWLFAERIGALIGRIGLRN